eukprot:CAMPEP_0171935228 /NCGR_PEP_ID=MMETSP0993-20121228/32709_1 /TAXON_ID=483369 /ORGANISM="non described non described, Strain CCMP2098" /LENGTH=487 /DNA_ID=CAMNT_0012576103 /DNA_START=155 /DNA_END=1618 /DNA_ORIENTATION=+
MRGLVAILAVLPARTSGFIPMRSIVEVTRQRGGIYQASMGTTSELTSVQREIAEDVEAVERRLSRLTSVDTNDEGGGFYPPPGLVKLSMALNVALALSAAEYYGNDCLGLSSVELLKNGILVGLPASILGCLIEIQRRRVGDDLQALLGEDQDDNRVLGGVLATSLSVERVARATGVAYNQQGQALERALLCAAVPVTLFAGLFMDDKGFGERAASDVGSEAARMAGEGEDALAEKRKRGEAVFLVGSTVAFVANLHLVSQTNLGELFNRLASQAAVGLLPSDLTYASGADSAGAPGAWTSASSPLAAAAWPLLAALPLASKPVAAVLAALGGGLLEVQLFSKTLPGITDNLASRALAVEYPGRSGLLRPSRAAKLSAQDEVLGGVANRNGTSYFLLVDSVSAERARRRDAILQRLVAARRQLLEEGGRRDTRASLARAALGSAAFFLSGGAPLAPILAYLGAELADTIESATSRGTFTRSADTAEQ